MKVLIFASLLIGASACSSQRSVNLTSTPSGADVREISSTGEQKSIGQTPLKVSVDSMESLYIEKDSYHPQKVFVSLNPGEQMDLNVKLQPKVEDYKNADQKKRLESLAIHLAQANNLLNNKKYPDAEVVLKNLVGEFPHVSVGYDLLGNIQYLKKDYRQAIYYYQKSLDINPENSLTAQTIHKLKSMMNQDQL